MGQGAGGEGNEPVFRVDSGLGKDLELRLGQGEALWKSGSVGRRTLAVLNLTALLLQEHGHSCGRLFDVGEGLAEWQSTHLLCSAPDACSSGAAGSG